MDESDSWGVFDQLAADEADQAKKLLVSRRRHTTLLAVEAVLALMLILGSYSSYLYVSLSNSTELADSMATQSARLAGVNYPDDKTLPLFTTPSVKASVDRTDRIVALQTLEERYSSDASDNLAKLIFVLTVLVGSLFGVLLATLRSARRAAAEYWKRFGKSPAPRNLRTEEKRRRDVYNQIVAGEIADDDKQLFFKYEKIRKDCEAIGIPGPPPYIPFAASDKETRTRKG